MGEGGRGQLLHPPSCEDRLTSAVYCSTVRHPVQRALAGAAWPSQAAAPVSCGAAARAARPSRAAATTRRSRDRHGAQARTRADAARLPALNSGEVFPNCRLRHRASPQLDCGADTWTRQQTSRSGSANDPALRSIHRTDPLAETVRHAPATWCA